MADITKVKEAAIKIKNQLNEDLKPQIEALTDVDIQEILSILEKTGINAIEVQKLKAEVDQATNKNEVFNRVLSAPGVLCEQIKGIIRRDTVPNSVSGE